MKRKNRLISFVITIILTSTFTGCFSYSDINKVTFPTSIMLDIDDEGNNIIYLDCVKPYRSTNDSSDKGRRVVYEGRGITPFQTLNSINSVSSNKLDYSQVKAYIFTEKAAKKGIDGFLDLINNSYEFPVSSTAFVYYGDVKELIETVSSEEEYLGLYLQDLANRYRGDARTIRSNINDYLNNTLIGSKTLMLASIRLKEDPLEKKIELSGGSIFNKDILVEQIEPKDSLTYNILTEPVNTGTLEIENPNSKGDFITLQIVYSNVKTDINYNEEKLELIKDIDIEVSLVEAQGKLTVNQETIEYIEETKGEFMNELCKEVFNKYKEKGLDIFNVQELVNQKYPEKRIDNILEKTEIKVNTNIILRGVGLAKDSL